MKKLRSRSSVLCLAVSLMLPIWSARAADHAFVVNFDSRELSVVDLLTEQVVDHWRTDRKPRGATTSPNGDYVYVAANHDLTLIDVLDPHNRIDVELNFGGLESTDVAVSDNGRYVLVSQRIASFVTVIDLDHPDLVACLEEGGDCQPGGAESTRELPFAGGEFIEAHPNGSFYLVNADGRIARAGSATSSFGEVNIPMNERPAMPGGMTIDTNGDVLVSTNVNCANTVGCVRRLTTGGAFSQMPQKLPWVGGIDVDPFTQDIIVTLPMLDEIARLKNGNFFRFQLRNADSPVAVAVGPSGGAVTANVGNNSTSIVWPGGARWALGAGMTPVAVAAGPDLEWSADPGSLEWTYSGLGVWRGQKTITVESTGDAVLVIDQLGLTGFDRANFDLVNDTCSGASLAPGQTCSVVLDFRAGAYDGFPRLYTHTYRAWLSIPSTSLSKDLVPLKGEHWLSGIKVDPIRPIWPAFRF